MDIETLTDLELDALVAEKVMGWKHLINRDKIAWQGTSNPEWHGITPEGIGAYVPHYSTDLAAAWLVAEVLRVKWGEFHLDIFHSVHPGIWENSDLWVCSNRSAYDRTHCEAIEGKDPSVARAICKAALKTVE